MGTPVCITRATRIHCHPVTVALVADNAVELPLESVDVNDIAISDGSIRLGQFLKLANLIDSGADAKAVIADGLVSVNGEVERRRGRQLVVGDGVEYEGLMARVVAD